MQFVRYQYIAVLRRRTEVCHPDKDKHAVSSVDGERRHAVEIRLAVDVHTEGFAFLHPYAVYTESRGVAVINDQLRSRTALLGEHSVETHGVCAEGQTQCRIITDGVFAAAGQRQKATYYGKEDLTHLFEIKSKADAAAR